MCFKLKRETHSEIKHVYFFKCLAILIAGHNFISVALNNHVTLSYTINSGLHAKQYA